ncbi:hypothetical protein ABH940_003180 [Streptacidiphilus sp. BW17]|uniref:hypothetical protein n=1 Tax=unclassified Streptacidiphilus TaxID=2643834 RepID=UPI0035116481
MSNTPPKTGLTTTINTIQRGLFAAVLALTATGAVSNQLLLTLALLAVVGGLLWLQTVTLRLPKLINEAAEQRGIPPILPSAPTARR